MEANELTWTGSPDDMTEKIEKNREEITNLLSSSLPIDLIVIRVKMLSRQNERLIKAKAAAINAMKEHLKTCKD